MRPAFTLGGRGGGIARDTAELDDVVARGLKASPIAQVLLEESVLGWGEFELEVMRDRNDNVVIVCSIENVDPMGVHTGDSVTVAPQQTLTDRQYQRLRDQAIAVIRAVGVETGGSNVQFAVNPATEEVVVIEMNPRVSRSSALASKATGFPIAKIAARLAVGYALEEIDNDITRAHAGELRADDRLRGGQVAALRLREVPRRRRAADHPHEVGRGGHGDRPHLPARPSPRRMRSRELDATLDLARATCSSGSSARRADRYRRAARGPAARRPRWTDAPRPHPASTRGSCAELAALRRATRVRPFAGERTFKRRGHLRRRVRGRDAVLLLGLGACRSGGAGARGRARGSASVMILGSGPNRIGQGIEFDYCCVHAAMTVRESRGATR